MVDYFARKDASELVVRFNGGAQAAHNVVTKEHQHVFRQFGSGSFAGAKTLYSKYSLFDPMMLLEESKLLQAKNISNPLSLIYVEEECVITTIFQQAMNRVRETLRGYARHGSCGMGIGETANDAENFPEHVLRVSDLKDRSLTYQKLEHLRIKKLEETLEISSGMSSKVVDTDLAMLKEKEYSNAAREAYCNIASLINIVSHDEALSMIANAHNPFFEGAQGVLLDQTYGFYPYITRSRVTPHDAISLCDEAGVTYVITGITRAYMVRHGPGPMPTEDKSLTAQLPDSHNTFGTWQRGFRVGYFDAVMTRLAIDICREDCSGREVDNLFVTCTDRLSTFEDVLLCNRYATLRAISPLSLESVGKERKSINTNSLLRMSPVYIMRFESSLEKSSLEYQINYAHQLHLLVDRNLNLMGISRGIRAEDKHLV